MKIVHTDDVRNWLISSNRLSDFTHSIGRRKADPDFVESALHLPFHLQFVVEQLSEEDEEVAADAFDSIPFYSLCKGLFLPMSYLTAERASQLFGFQAEEPPQSAEREALLKEFLDKDLGLTLVEKLGCVLGDVFIGRKSTFRRDSLVRLLLSVVMRTRNELLDELTRVGDVAVLFAESRNDLHVAPQLTAAEVIRTLRFIPDARQATKFKLLRSLLTRCGRLEAFFLAKLMLRKAGFGLEYQGPLLARTLAEKFQAPVEQVSHAMALTDVFHVAQTLMDEGVEGLKSIQLQPLVPVKPSLAAGTTDEIDQFPVWVERKYDGIRFMLHKSTDARGAVLCGAYTRNRGDWLEMIPGMDGTIRALPALNSIVDGELFGTVLDIDHGARPASVYEVYAALQGESATPVNLKFAAFDLIYLNGQDLTNLPLSNRRMMLQNLGAPLANMSTPIPFSVSEGQLANSKDDINRLFHHFRAQGYEGIITKNLNAPYALNARDPNWKKRKPEITLDLAITGAILAVTTKEHAGTFGSFVISAQTPEGGWQVVGDVAGVDRVREQQIHHEIMRDGLLTGKRIERPSSSGVRPGMELRPSIVVTVKFEGITRDQATGELSLRDPKIAVIRSDKSASECDVVDELQEIYLRQRVG